MISAHLKFAPRVTRAQTRRVKILKNPSLLPLFPRMISALFKLVTGMTGISFLKLIVT
jgi:hypothetical protein